MCRIRAYPLIASLIMAVAAPAPVGGAPLMGTAEADSVQVLRDAQGEVRRYLERVRREGLPESRPGGEGGTRAASPRERRERFLTVAMERRAELIRTLDEFGRKLPGDDWIAGFRVGLRIKQGRVDEAVREARACRASSWWCDVLLGFTLHVHGGFAEAENAFDSGLEGMPRDLRCGLTDETALLLEGELRKRYVEADCEERIRLERRIWCLADPLHTRPGNDRRTEHLSRLVAMRLHHQTLELQAADCGARHHSRVILGGWQPWWWTAVPLGLDLELEGFPFIPSAETWLQPMASGPSSWEVSPRRGGERYFPDYGPIAHLDQQTGFFARGDSIVAVAAMEAADPMVLAGLALSRSEDHAPTVVERTAGRGPFRFRTRMPRDTHLVSVEALPAGGGASRARFGHGLPGPNARGLSLSDLLVFDWEEDLEEELGAVFPRMLGTSRLEPGREVGVFWEMYGVEEASTLDVSLAVRPVDRGFFRRLGEALRIVSPPNPVRVSWREALDDRAALGKHLRLDLSLLEPGAYEVLLEVDDRSGEPVTVRRHIEVLGS